MRPQAVILFSILLLRAAPATAADPPDTLTYTVRIGENPLGTMVWIARAIPEGMEGSTRTTLRVTRGAESLLCTQEIFWREDGEGTLQGMSSVLTGMGPEAWRDAIERVPEKGSWRRTRTRGGETMLDSLPGGPLLGPLAFEKRLAEGRMEALTRVWMLDPERMQPTLYRIHRAGTDTLRLTDGSAVRCGVYAVEDSSSGGVVHQWRDAEGRLWEEADRSIGMVSERSEVEPRTREAASREGTGSPASPRFDAARWMLVPIQGNCPPEGPCDLLLEPESSDAAGAKDVTRSPIPDGPDQKVTPGDRPGTWVVHLAPRALPPASGSDRRAWRWDSDLAGALRSGLFVDSDSPAIRAFADSAATAAGGNPTHEAALLEQAVHDRIRLKDYSTVMATASETLARSQGDCTEHAILLAALCRARGIPARLVAGLTPQRENEMAWHLWTEVWLGGWVALDATRGQGGPSPGTVGLLWMERPEDELVNLERSIGVLSAGYGFHVLEGAK